MMNHEKLTSIGDLVTRSERVRVDVNIPKWVEGGQVGVNLEKMERLMDLGGIRHVRVEAIKKKRDALMPEIMGVTANGSAFAGRSIAAERSLLMESDSSGISEEDAILQNAVWTNLKIALNMEAFRERVNERNGNLRDINIWAEFMDGALRKGIRNEGTKHLIAGHSVLRSCVAFVVNIHNNLMIPSGISMWRLITGSLKFQTPSIDNVAFLMGLSLVTWTLIGTYRHGANRGDGRGYRLSLFPGYEIDRALVLQMMTRAQSVVGIIPT